jgi:subtilisin family serine protease
MFSATNQRRLRQVIALVVIIALVPVVLLAATPRRVLAQEDLAEISAQIAAAGSARVIVSYDVAREPEAQLSAAQQRSQRSRIAQAQDLVARRLADSGAVEVRRLATVPVSAYVVNAAALARLQQDPLVSAISIDGLRKPQMYNSNGVIGADDVWALGATGSGQTVAVLDTGVNKNHPFLSGRVVSEACYSTTYAPFGSTSLCPGGVQSSTAANSGLDCVTTIAGCGHGTHVAGTVAGKPLTWNNYNIRGVAPGAKIIAVQVFSRFPKEMCGEGATTPCALSFDSDQMAGLERVYALRNTYDIASVNMSLGGGEYAAACDNEVSNYTALIGDLKDAGIATVIASGNDGFTGSIGFPACISEAVTVGSTANVAEYPEDPAVASISTFSNVSAQVDLYAPGEMILSSTGSGYSWYAGTSMATPHVAGAFALLASVAPNLSVDQLLAVLEGTGTPISGRGQTIPRIQVDAAVNTWRNAPIADALSGSAGALEVNWLSSTSAAHTVKVERLPVGSATWSLLSNVTGTPTLSTTMSTIDSAATAACAYRLTNTLGSAVSSPTTLITNTASPAVSATASSARMGSTFSIYACGLPATTSIPVSVNGTAVVTPTTDASGRLLLNVATSGSSAFGRYDLTLDVPSADPIELSYVLISTDTLRSAGAANGYPTATTVNVPSSVAPRVETTLFPLATR